MSKLVQAILAVITWDAYFTGDLPATLKKRSSANTQMQKRIAKDPLKLLAENHSSILSLYNMLCDMVHPNIGSHMLLLRQQSDHSRFKRVQAQSGFIGGSSDKIPARDLLSRALAGMMAIYPIMLNDLNRLINFYLPSASNSGPHGTLQ